MTGLVAKGRVMITIRAKCDRWLASGCLAIVNEMTTRPIGTEACGVESATKFRLVLWMSS